MNMHRIVRPRTVGWLATLAMIVPAVGCGSGIKLGAVTGHVTKDGKPQPQLSIEFTPLQGGRSSEGYTNNEGRYELVYSLDKMGAEVGNHQVRISAPDKSQQSSADSAPYKEILTVQREIKSGSNVIDIELTQSQ